jgi:hypothetical protein
MAMTTTSSGHSLSASARWGPALRSLILGAFVHLRYAQRLTPASKNGRPHARGVCKGLVDEPNGPGLFPSLVSSSSASHGAFNFFRCTKGEAASARAISSRLRSYSISQTRRASTFTLALECVAGSSASMAA